MSIFYKSINSSTPSFFPPKQFLEKHRFAIRLLNDEFLIEETRLNRKFFFEIQRVGLKFFTFQEVFFIVTNF